jgi:phage portal protein BeeE
MLISEAIAGMPLAAYRGLVQLTPTPPVLVNPAGPNEDRCTTVAAWVGDLIDHGNAVGFIMARDAEGVPTVVMPVPASEVVVGFNAAGRLTYEHHVNGVVARTADWSQVFHAKGVLPFPGALRGLGVLEAGLSSLARIRDEDAYAAKAFHNGTPSGLLRVKDPDLQPGTP